jgi:hypothetical protein
MKRAFGATEVPTAAISPPPPFFQPGHAQIFSLSVGVDATTLQSPKVLSSERGKSRENSAVAEMVSN